MNRNSEVCTSCMVLKIPACFFSRKDRKQLICKTCSNADGKKRRRSKGHLDRKNGVNNKHSKSVVQLSKMNDIINTYPSALEAYRQTGISNSNINQCCRGKRKTAGKFKWQFITE